MIRFVSGLPGSGKGVWMIAKIIRRLIETDRMIATNLPVKFAELNVYLQEKYREEWQGQDLHERLRILKDEEVFEFFRVRPEGLKLPETSDWEIRTGKRDKRDKLDRLDFVKEIKGILEMGKNAGGVDYFIDECHDYFDAREWEFVGRPLTYYASKHRHLRDMVWFASQNPQQVETRLKGLCQERLEMRNLANEQWWLFRRRPRFRCSVYYKCPEKLDTVQAMHTVEFPLRLDQVNCYQSTGAVGGDGAQVDPQDRPKALPWWSVWVLGGLAVLLGACVLVEVPKMGIKRVMKGSVGQFDEARDHAREQQRAERPVQSQGEALSGPASNQGAPVLIGDERPTVVGLTHVRGEKGFVWVQLSDGRTFDSRGTALETVDLTRWRVKIRGEWFDRGDR